MAALQRADLEQVARTLQGAARDTSRAAPVGPLAQLAAADALAVETPLRLREHLAATLETTGSSSVLRSRAGTLALREEDVAPVKALLADGRLTAGDLGTGPGPAAAAGRSGRGGLSEPPAAFRCATAARGRADPMAGSAPQARGWLLLEHPGPWPVDAVAGSGIEPRDPAVPAGRGGGRRRSHPPGPPAGSSGARCAAALGAGSSRPGHGHGAVAGGHGSAGRGGGPGRPADPRRTGPRLRLTPSSWSARTGCTTPAAPSAVARSRRRWPSTSLARCGSAATWAATGSRPTWCCCPTASTTATSTPRRRSAPCGSTWPARWTRVGCGAWPSVAAARAGRGGGRVRTPRAPRARRGVGRAGAPGRPARRPRLRDHRPLRIAGAGRVRVEVVAVRRPAAQLTCRAARETPATAYEIVSFAV